MAVGRLRDAKPDSQAWPAARVDLYEVVIAHLVDELRPRLAELLADRDRQATVRLRQLIET